jgi:two-component system KDP operon response regulator KdpE
MARSEPLVLVVEDDPPMLRFIRRTLEVNGLTVTVATDGPVALQRFRADMPDLVVLDIGIPGLDGLEVCRLMKSEHQAPVIMVTARGTDEDVVRGFEVGAEDYLAKPFAGSVLVARVKALLRRAQTWAGLPGDLMECADLVAVDRQR